MDFFCRLFNFILSSTVPPFVGFRNFHPTSDCQKCLSIFRFCDNVRESSIQFICRFFNRNILCDSVFIQSFTFTFFRDGTFFIKCPYLDCFCINDSSRRDKQFRIQHLSIVLCLWTHSCHLRISDLLLQFCLVHLIWWHSEVSEVLRSKI